MENLGKTVSVLSINLFLASIGPLFFAAWFFGFPFILLHTIITIYFKKTTYLGNLLVSVISATLITIFINLLIDIILIGMLFQMVGLLLALFITPLVITNLFKNLKEIK